MALTNQWVIAREGSPNTELTLFCFPYAGRGASAFRLWKEHLPQKTEFAWIQLPGRENRIQERPFSSMEDLIPVLAAGILQAIDRPFAFYGHSLGARIAFEVARAFRRCGKPLPRHLFVGASEPPQLPWAHPLLHRLPEGQFIEAIEGRYGGIPREVVADPELRALLLPTLRADVTLLETYRYIPEPPLACPITLFTGTEDRVVNTSMIDEWRNQTTGTFCSHRIRGDHFFLHSGRKEVLDFIAAEMLRQPLCEGGTCG